MVEGFIVGLLRFSAVGCGLLAGVYFAFSTFIMAALGRIGPASGISAMQAVNSVILRSLFMPLFLGTTLTSAVLSILGIVRGGEPGALSMLAGGVIYVAGMFLCTMFRNVPLNNLLVSLDPAAPTAAPAWERYRRDWTRWNHVRTVSSTLATALFIAAIAART